MLCVYGLTRSKMEDFYILRLEKGEGICRESFGCCYTSEVIEKKDG